MEARTNIELAPKRYPAEVLSEVPCNLCGAMDYAYWLTRIDGLNVVRCRNCSLTFINPRPKDQCLQEIYDKSYYEGDNPVRAYHKYIESQMQLLEEPHRDFRLRQLLKYARNFEPGGSALLDIGCAIGTFLLLARKAGWRVSGVEVSPFSSEYGRRHFNLAIFTGTLLEAQFPDSSFDMVTMFDVLEHVPDPSAMLSEIHRCLKPEGRVLIYSPNVEYAKKEGADWRGFTSSLEHIYFFDTTTIIKMANKCGFRVIDRKIVQEATTFENGLKQSESVQKARARLKKFKPLFTITRGVWRLFNNTLRLFSERVQGGDQMLIVAQKNI